MSDQPFDRVIFNTREQPLSSDWNQLASELDRPLRDFLMRFCMSYFSTSFMTGVPVNAFAGDSFRPYAPGGMFVTLISGIGFQYLVSDVPTDIGSVVGLDDLSAYKPLWLSTNETIAVPAADPTNPRYDIIQVKCDRRADDSQTRNIFNPATEVFDPTLVNKNLNFNLSGRAAFNDTTAGINYKTGTAAASPVAPTADAGYVTVAQILVPAAAAGITSAHIIDKRRQLAPNANVAVGVKFNGAVDPATPPAAPTLSTLSAPPGWLVSVSCFDNGVSHVFRIYMLPAGGVVSAQAVASVYGAALGVLDTTYTCTADASVGTLNSTQVTTLANGTAGEPCSPARTVAVGMPYVLIELYPRLVTTAAVTQAGFVTGTFNVVINCQV